MLLSSAASVRASGARLLRGGAFKPRTSPCALRGLGTAALEMVAEARDVTGMPIVTELMDARDIDAVDSVADVIQIGARNMQNFRLPLVTPTSSPRKIDVSEPDVAHRQERSEQAPHAKSFQTIGATSADPPTTQ